jgi:hypothetical protein
MNKLTTDQNEAYNGKRKEFDRSREINTISPCVAPLNNMYFTVEGNPINKYKDGQDIWMSTRDENGEWKKAERLPDYINSQRYNGVYACSNDGTAAYWAGGYANNEAGGSPKNIYKMVYSSDTRSIISTGTYGGNYKSGCSNGTTAGYINRGSFAGDSSIDKINFSNDTISTLSSVLASGRYAAAAFANGTTAGYWAGGQPPSTGQTSINKITFSNDTGSSLSATLSTGRHGASGFSNSGTAGYAAGGYDGSPIAGIDKITYASDNKSTLSATLSAGRNYPGAFSL